jgi:hypothetical protein
MPAQHTSLRSSFAALAAALLTGCTTALATPQAQPEPPGTAAPSPVPIERAGRRDPDEGLVIAAVTETSADETWEQPWRARRLVRDQHNELLISLHRPCSSATARTLAAGRRFSPANPSCLMAITL